MKPWQAFLYAAMLALPLWALHGIAKASVECSSRGGVYVRTVWAFDCVEALE